MKQLKIYLWILFFLPAFLFSSCEKLFDTEQEGILELAIMIDGQEQLKSALNDSTNLATRYLIVTVVNENGEAVLNDEQIELFDFGGHWITKNIKLKVGSYELTRFLIVDPQGIVLYAAPLEDSPKSYLVNDPLPIQFEILKDQVTKVVPEVLPVHEELPEEFGYVTFSYTIVRPLDFFIAVYIKNSVIVPPVEYTDAKLNVKVDSLWWHSFDLEPTVNKVTIRDGYRCYSLIIEKEGFSPVRLKLTREVLAGTTPENPLLIGILTDSLNVIVFQPGPEEGKDAFIEDYPYNNYQNRNWGKSEEWSAISWTAYGTPFVVRSLIDFNFDAIPPNVIIVSAELSLFAHGNIGHKWGHDPLTGSNACYLLRVISEWQEDSVTWNTQPPVTEENRALIPQSDSTMQNYIGIDVTDLVRDCYNHPEESFGLMLRLVEEEGYRRMFFASSDIPDPAKRPKLEVYYTVY
jgi:hypothetical protein